MKKKCVLVTLVSFTTFFSTLNLYSHEPTSDESSSEETTSNQDQESDREEYDREMSEAMDRYIMQGNIGGGSMGW